MLIPFKLYIRKFGFILYQKNIAMWFYFQSLVGVLLIQNKLVNVRRTFDLKSFIHNSKLPIPAPLVPSLWYFIYPSITVCYLQYNWKKYISYVSLCPEKKICCVGCPVTHNQNSVWSVFSKNLKINRTVIFFTQWCFHSHFIFMMTRTNTHWRNYKKGI